MTHFWFLGPLKQLRTNWIVCCWSGQPSAPLKHLVPVGEREFARAMRAGTKVIGITSKLSGSPTTNIGILNSSVVERFTWRHTNWTYHLGHKFNPFVEFDYGQIWTESFIDYPTRFDPRKVCNNNLFKYSILVLHAWYRHHDIPILEVAAGCPNWSR